MNRRYVAILLLCFSANSFAKCRFETYLVEGIISSTSGTPTINTRVDIEWLDYAGTHKKSVATNSAGRYQLKISFNTYSGHGGKYEPEDTCNQTLKQLSLRTKDKVFKKKLDIASANKITFDITD
jgi:hypothetical protein